jgi:hypothetical protein
MVGLLEQRKVVSTVSESVLWRVELMETLRADLKDKTVALMVDVWVDLLDFS